MLQIQSLTSTISYSNIMTDKKIHSSIGTEDTNDDTFKKKISLCSCSSSISLEQNLQHSQQKQIFARFLFESNKQKSQKIFKEMVLIYQSFHLQQDCQRQYLVDISESQADREGKILTYFVDIWLRHMGYGTKKNRSSFLGKVKIFFGHDALKSFSRLYDDLNLIPLLKAQKKVFLLKTCRNGWEFFIQQLSKKATQIRMKF